jgi:hypothetical protein
LLTFQKKSYKRSKNEELLKKMKSKDQDGQLNAIQKYCEDVTEFLEARKEFEIFR